MRAKYTVALQCQLQDEWGVGINYAVLVHNAPCNKGNTMPRLPCCLRYLAQARLSLRYNEREKTGIDPFGEFVSIRTNEIYVVMSLCYNEIFAHKF